MISKIFFIFFKISLFATGGAYSFLPLLERELVENQHWLSKREFLDVLGMVKIMPGAISIKYATYAGHKIGGISGALAANLGNILPTVIIVFLAGTFYAKYKELPRVKDAFSAVELAVFAMIVAVALQTLNFSQAANIRGIFIIVIAFILFMFTKVHPALIIVGAGVLGVFLK